MRSAESCDSRTDHGHLDIEVTGQRRIVGGRVLEPVRAVEKGHDQSSSVVPRQFPFETGPRYGNRCDVQHCARREPRNRVVRPRTSRQLRIGCSGWNYPHWRAGVFYPPRLPQRDWLTYYAERFDTVELNTTFYRLPQAAVVARWVSETPPGFIFAVKVSRYITHVKRLTEVSEHLPLLYERIEPLLRSPKLGPLLWQLPPTFRYDPGRLEDTLEYLHDGHRHAFEFRHPSWFRTETYSLLQEHGAALVIADRPSVNTFQTHELTTDYTYVRFHAGTRGRNGNYSRSELTEWAGRLDRWSKKVDVFAYFNNDWEGYAINNAIFSEETPPAASSLAEPASARRRRGSMSAEPFLPKRLTLPALAEAVQHCRGCPLYADATQAVFGEGRRSARVMLVGEQPGDQEDRAGTPFVGPAGQLLDRALDEAGIDRKETYVTNAVKHFKWKPRGPRRIHDKPSWSEQLACRPGSTRNWQSSSPKS